MITVTMPIKEYKRMKKALNIQKVQIKKLRASLQEPTNGWKIIQEPEIT